jgi:hypothetical protein
MRPRRSRLDRLQRALRDETRPLAPVLREVTMLGGDTHSTALRTWALHELQGYENSDVPIPDYRRIPAPLMMDYAAGMGVVTGHQVSYFELPDFAQDALGNELRLGTGVHQIESLIASHRDRTVPLGPSMAADLAQLMSQQLGRHITRLYWSVHVSALEGVLDQIRTRLVQLVAELLAAGDNSSINVAAPIAIANRGGSASASVTAGAQRTIFHRSALLWTILTALASATAVAVWGLWL